MDTEGAARILAETHLFSKVGEDVRRALAVECIPRSYRKGDLIFHEGDPGEALFVVVEGTVKVFITSRGGDEMVLGAVKPREQFGELAVIYGGVRAASARALTDVTLLAIPRGAFLRARRDNPSLTDALLESLGALLARTLSQAADLVFLDLPGRLAKLLLQLAEEERRAPPGDEAKVTLHVNQSDLARMIGGSRSTVNQILRTFEARGYCVPEGKNVLRLEVGALRRRAGL